MEYENSLYGINMEGIMFEAAKEDLLSKYNKQTMIDLLQHLMIKRQFNECYNMIVSLFKEGIAEDIYVDIFCKNLNDNFEWMEQEEVLAKIRATFKDKGYIFSHKQLLKLANAFELAYAKSGLGKEIVIEVYQHISSNNDFDFFSQEAIRIKCAKVAYSANKYNANEKIDQLLSLKRVVKRAGIKGVTMILNYYLGLCERYVPCDYEQFWMIKSKNRGFPLAEEFMNNITIHNEASKTARNAVGY